MNAHWASAFAWAGNTNTPPLAGRSQHRLPAPTASFTVYSATPQRDSAIVGFATTATVARAVHLYLRFDGELASGTDNHALNLGVRLSW